MANGHCYWCGCDLSKDGWCSQRCITQHQTQNPEGYNNSVQEDNRPQSKLKDLFGQIVVQLLGFVIAAIIFLILINIVTNWAIKESGGVKPKWLPLHHKLYDWQGG